MKKLLLAVLLLLAGCTEEPHTPTTHVRPAIGSIVNITTVEYDGCKYICFTAGSSIHVEHSRHCTCNQPKTAEKP